jgi:hypothetical protein
VKDCRSTVNRSLPFLTLDTLSFLIKNEGHMPVKCMLYTFTIFLSLSWSLCGHLGILKTKLNSVVLVRKRTMPTERPQPADKVSANFS